MYANKNQKSYFLFYKIFIFVLHQHIMKKYKILYTYWKTNGFNLLSKCVVHDFHHNQSCTHTL